MRGLREGRKGESQHLAQKGKTAATVTGLVAGRVLDIEDPSDGSPVLRVPMATEAEIVAAVAAARAALPGWAATAAADRAAAVARAADAVAARTAELARLTSQEMGRPGAQARAGVAAGV